MVIFHSFLYVYQRVRYQTKTPSSPQQQEILCVVRGRHSQESDSKAQASPLLVQETALSCRENKEKIRKLDSHWKLHDLISQTIDKMDIYIYHES